MMLYQEFGNSVCLTFNVIVGVCYGIICKMILSFQMQFPTVDTRFHYIDIAIPNNATIHDVVSLFYQNI